MEQLILRLVSIVSIVFIFLVFIDNDIFHHQGAIASIHFIITCAAKYDVDDKILIQEIQQLGLPKENSETICKQYRENKDNLRQILEDKSYRISHFLAADWRVDQVLGVSNSSSAQGFEMTKEKIVHINMKINNNTDSKLTVDRELAFEISADKLDLLIHELSQAEKLMEEVNS